MKSLLFLFFFSFTLFSMGQDSLKIMFYNVENLFDTFDDSTKNDNEFLPKSGKHWTLKRYHHKLNQIAKVIVNTPGDRPDLIGLCEIENIKVLKDLVFHPILKKDKYSIIHFESPDRRGIDNALLYKESSFDLLFSMNHPVLLERHRPTRDILHVKGILNNNDTLNVFVNHWPSRYGGRKKSDPKRMIASNKLKQLCDSISNESPSEKIVVTGDFNDDQTDSSIIHLLSNKNLIPIFNEQKNFSLKYKKNWDLFDQYFLSPNLKNSVNYAKVMNYSWLQTEDFKYSGIKPFRTYYGYKYIGGYSDHFPILLNLKL